MKHTALHTQPHAVISFSKIKKFVLFIITSIFISIHVFGLSNGDIMFVGFSADDIAPNGIEGFSFVALKIIPASTLIVFDDGEGTITWTSPVVSVEAGTVVNITHTESPSNVTASIGTVVRTPGFNISGDNEAIDAMEGTTCLAGIANNGSSPMPNCTSLSSDYIVRISGDNDVMVYNGSTSCNGTLAECIAMIANTANWITQDDTGDQSNDGIPPDFPGDVPTSLTGSALPIDLVSFTGKAKDDAITLIWQTLSETNNDYFLIEKVLVGKDFHEIGRVPGAGTSLKENNYTFTDPHPAPGANYYRLKQVDYDGRFSYSPVVSVNWGGEDGFRIFPSPVVSNLHVALPQNWEDAEDIIVFDLLGQVRKRWHLDGTAQEVELDVSGLPPGIFVMEAVSGRRRVVMKFEKN
ncbi:MAG: T9SS type A sorting domain-containing protein [Saprospiraceae bacterium]|nr:MAG: T9SS type A sorting domain-containing protein [Saprospiraceae bacterium]